MLVFLFGCAAPGAPLGGLVPGMPPSEDSVGGTDTGGQHALVAVEGLPSHAPAVILLGAINSAGEVSVTANVEGDLEVDLDGVEDDTAPFRASVLDEEGALLAQRTVQGPVLVREILGYYADQSGYDILGLIPQLGRFPIHVPLLDGGDTVLFERREGTGWVEAGQVRLSELDDVGVSEAVEGSETLWEGGDSSERLDLVLLGDGYTESELDQWAEDADAFTSTMLATPPFSAWGDLINIHRVDLASAESGASYDCVDSCEVKDTGTRSGRCDLNGYALSRRLMSGGRLWRLYVADIATLPIPSKGPERVRIRPLAPSMRWRW